jgi:hypothetical protein
VWDSILGGGFGINFFPHLEFETPGKIKRIGSGKKVWGGRSGSRNPGILGFYLGGIF